MDDNSMSLEELDVDSKIAWLSACFLVFGLFAACTDAPADGESTPGQNTTSNAGDNDESGDNDGDNGGENGGDNGGDNGGENGDDNDENSEPEPDCDNLECDQVDCPPGESTTSLSGTVYIPSGALPLPNVTVYIPNDDLDPITDELSCQRCEEMVSGDPLVQGRTDEHGRFFLDDVPAGENIPLVMQTGKWRRQVEISTIEECSDNTVDNDDKMRLPRNRNEGSIPDIAVTTGGWDALQCLVYAIGVDIDEFTNQPDEGSITLYAGATDGTDRFANDVQGGESFFSAQNWWDDFDAMAEHDIVLHSCDYGTYPTNDARQVLQEYADEGGRVFMTDQHRVWLEDGPSDFQSVADWQGMSSSSEIHANIDTTFSGGQTMFEWMDHTDGLTDDDQLVIWDVWNNVGSIDENLATQWIYSGADQEHYFSFTTPVGAPEDQECGRVVYSDLHIADGGDSNPYDPFPDGCTGAALSGQEKALVYLFFDLTSCVAPECVPDTCDDIPEDCGVHSDGCGGSIDCGECCVDLGGDCEEDDDCCDDLWCDPTTDTCVDDCRSPGEPCTSGDQCCSGLCSGDEDEEGACIEA